MDNTGKFFRIDIAGLYLKLDIGDGILARRASSLFSTVSAKSTGGTIDVTVQPSGIICDDPDTLRLDGHGEYAGSLDIATGRARVRLTDPHSIHALLNFLRQLITRLVESNGGLVLHAACVNINKRAFLFAGPSGAGKSTVCRLAPSHAEVVGDDLTAVRQEDGEFNAWGMPAPAAGPTCAVNRDCRGPFGIAAVYTLAKADRDRATRIPSSIAAASLLTLHAGDTDETTTARRLALVSELVNHVPCYELQFRKSPAFWDLIAGKPVKRPRRTRGAQ